MKIKDKNIVSEMETSFLDYAMSVIVSRALPDVRDGLKPVHRRILYAMSELGNYSDKPYKKSARIVGDVIGKYHPHGDSSVYSAMVRMAQDFSYKKPLVDGHGNFGSLDGDGAAAMRYTEARMSKIAMEMIKDINKETIDFQENYDGSELEPKVLPAKFPNLLINGANGIAVGMATNIPPHNINEVIDALIEQIKNPEINLETLCEYIKGPDFPLGGIILGDAGIKKAYASGKGNIKIRSKCEIIENEKRSTIIVKEIPYQVNKAMLVEKIAEVARHKKVEGIRDLRDESDKDGVRIVIELQTKANPHVVLNSLFKNTNLEMSYSINLLALDHGRPRIMNLKEILDAYIKHQQEILIRKLKFELRKAEEKAHFLSGLMIAVNNIDDVIEIIKNAKTQEDASNILISKYELSKIQAKAILDMQLKRLTGLEIEKLKNEYAEINKIINELKELLSSQEKMNNVIIEELQIIKEKYKENRKTEIIKGHFDSIDDEDLIDEQQMIVTLTKSGYIKRVNEETYRAQNRGGTGIKAMSTNDEDNVENILSTSTHSDLLFFTNVGKVYKIRAHRIPEFNRTAKGLPLINLINMEEHEKISNILTINNYENGYLVFVTKKGKIKKTKISEYERINVNGKKAIKIIEDDEIQQVLFAKDNENIIAATKLGKAILIELNNIKPLSRNSSGVKLITLEKNDEIVGFNKITENSLALSITNNGFGKATRIENYRIQNRGGKGITNIKLTEKTGKVIAFTTIDENELENKDIMLITKTGQLIRMKLKSIKISARATQGVKMMRLKDDDEIVKFEIVESQNVEENE